MDSLSLSLIQLLLHGHDRPTYLEVAGPWNNSWFPDLIHSVGNKSKVLFYFTKNLCLRFAKKGRAKHNTVNVARFARIHENETFGSFLNSTVALIRLLRNKWSCLVNPEFRIPRFFWWDLLNCLWWEKLRENWLSNRNNISRERTKSFWGDDLAPWRYPPKPTPKKEKAETTQTIIMNWSLERSVHILHLHLFSFCAL